MGVALFAALDGRQQLAIPAEAYAALDPSTGGSAADGRRQARQPHPDAEHRRQALRPDHHGSLDHDPRRREGGRAPPAVRACEDGACRQPPAGRKTIPPSIRWRSSPTDETDAAPPVSRTGTIYGSDVESEVALKTVDFPLKGSTLKFAPLDVAGRGRGECPHQRFGADRRQHPDRLAVLCRSPTLCLRRIRSRPDRRACRPAIVEENMTVSAFENITDQSTEYADDIIPVRRATPIATVLLNAGYAKAQAEDVAGLSAAAHSVRRNCRRATSCASASSRRARRRGKDRPRQRLFARHAMSSPWRWTTPAISCKGYRAAATGRGRHCFRRQWHAGDRRRPRPAARL